MRVEGEERLFLPAALERIAYLPWLELSSVFRWEMWLRPEDRTSAWERWTAFFTVFDRFHRGAAWLDTDEAQGHPDWEQRHAMTIERGREMGRLGDDLAAWSGATPGELVRLALRVMEARNGA